MVRNMRVPFTFWPESYLQNGRITTRDPWRCIQVHIHQNAKKAEVRNRALAFLEQAEDFHHAASAPRVASKPLLYYYSFMNLAKAYLVIKRGVKLDRCIHGLKEPRANVRSRLTITSQAIVVNDAEAKGPIHVYREFIQQCGFSVPSKPKPFKLVDLLEQTVSINNIISRSMGRPPQFFPIDHIAFRCNPERKEVWISFYVDRNELAASHLAAGQVRENATAFEEVESPKPDYRCYESRTKVSYGKTPLQALSPLVRNTWHDLWSELVPGGYRFWVSTVAKTKRLAQLAAAYQTMFYFGSVTRYRPDDFHKLADGKHGWMVQEFVNSQPIQFAYFLGSGLIDVEMAIPNLTIG